MIRIKLTDTLITVNDGVEITEIPVHNGLPIVDMSRDGSFIMIAESQEDGSERLLFSTNDKFSIVRG